MLQAEKKQFLFHNLNNQLFICAFENVFVVQIVVILLGLAAVALGIGAVVNAFGAVLQILAVTIAFARGEKHRNY